MKEYPYIGKDKEDQIILFTRESEGIVIESKFSMNKVNVLYRGWFENNFTDITEEYLADKKIEILSPLHSEYVQKLAFKYGYGWNEGFDSSVQLTNKSYLFFYKMDKDICYSDDDYCFVVESGFEEITIPLPKDYVSDDDISVGKENDVEEFKVGDEILYDGTSFPEIKREKVKVIGVCETSKGNQVLTVEHIEQGVIAILNGSWFSKPKTEEELLLESLEFDIQSSKDNCDTALGTAVKLMENYSITKKPQ